MSVQAGKTGTTNIGQDILKAAAAKANENSQMTGITVSMEAMFFMETKEDDEVSESKCASFATRLLESFMPDKKVAVLPEQHADIFATDMMTAPTHSSDLYLCSNDLDNENFGDCEDFSNFRHFFSLISRPTVAADIPAIMMGTMDRLTSRPFGTSEATTMRIRVGHNDLRHISSLALALNTPDQDWMNRLSRHSGKKMASEPWAERTLKERLIANVLSSEIDLNDDLTASEWAELFERKCDFGNAEDDFFVTSLDVGHAFVSFNHIAGEGYEVDFGTNLEIVEEMCKVVDRSIVKNGEDYWDKPENAQKIAALLNEISQIKATADQIKFVKTPTKQPSYHIVSEGDKVGKVSIYNSDETGFEGMSNSVLSVGPLAVWIEDQNSLPFEAAILMHRTAR
ncbi:hypothetical protein [Sulfitobacter sp. R18_1]|uniref:hypothetical protein n=1 Tax=Sulfitobacter sp. R18_1 TaxID=2821104 RepID=UPI001ADB2B6B|nr:hypothetical protein [Sulfitobacter sp. R18_1]MBO9428387.1 hypothetical protein [Sulfitobacter sp. R18_1]